jgi:hypothetical protein
MVLHSILVVQAVGSIKLVLCCDKRASLLNQRIRLIEKFYRIYPSLSYSKELQNNFHLKETMFCNYQFSKKLCFEDIYGKLIHE